MFFTFATFAVETRASQYISKCSGYAIASDGITNSFSIIRTGKMPDIGVTKIQIKNLADTTVATYNYTDIGDSYMIGHNVSSYSGSVTYENAVSGSQYYVVIYFKAGNGSGCDTDSYITELAIA